MAVSVREKPRTALHYVIETPSGNRYRHAEDEPSAENIPSGAKFGDSMPGGFDQCEYALPRKPGVTYQDLERLSTIYVKGPGGEPAGEYRLERTPRTSGTERSISVQGVGWQAHLEDNKSASEVYVDRDLSHWGTMSRQRRLNLIAATFSYIGDGQVDADTSTGLPALQLGFDGTGAAVSFFVEMWYDAGAGNTLGSIYYDFTSTNSLSTYSGAIGISSNDLDTFHSITADLLTGTNSTGTGTLSATTAFRYGFVQHYVAGISPSAVTHLFTVRRVAVFGSHGLTKRGTAPDEGFYASDIIANAVSRWAPLLNYSTGADGTIKPTTFVIPQLEFREPTTVADMIQQANRFHIRDWAVWDDKTLYYHDRGDRGKAWRARVAPAQLEETGPAVDRLWNGVIVQFRDVDGTMKTVGPTGSSADSTSSDLIDTDSENPANKLGIRRWTKIDMGIVSTTAAATEVGRRFLIETKALDSSGKAQLVGHVEDDKGVVRPYWQVRSGDTISFVDAADTSPRRIVKTEKDVDARTCTVDLDAPPDGLNAILERLGVVLVPLGL